MIRLTIPSIEEDDLGAVREALVSGFLVQGSRVAAFEKAVAEYVGSRHAIAVSNCTAALHLALLALGVGPGDLVVTTTYSWVATANVIELCGAEPVFVDIQPDTFNMDPSLLEDTLTRLMSNPITARRTKAILPVHTFGQMADMPTILAVAGRYNLPVVEDAACALGASWDGKQAGGWGTLGCFSFHPRKAITTGEGGIVTTDSDALADRVRALRNHGLDPQSPVPAFIMPGFNCRMTEFQAALGVTQMSKLDRIILSRRRLAAMYDSLFEDDSFVPSGLNSISKAVYQSYVILLPDSVSEHRQRLITTLKEQGVETTIGTWHMPLTDYYCKRYSYRNGDFPVTDNVFRRALTLPLYEGLSAEDQAKVVECLRSAVKTLREA